MSLRARLIAFFFVLAVAPLAAIGLLGYVQSMRALRALLERQTEAIVERVSTDLRERHQLRESDLMLLGGNAETQELYRALAADDLARQARARAAADEYLRAAWAQLGRFYEAVEFRDSAGRLVYRLGEPLAGAASASALLIMQPVVDDQTSRTIGSLTALVQRDALLDLSVLESRFGHAGYTMVVDRERNEVLYHPRHALIRQPLSQLTSREGWALDTAEFGRGRGSLRYRDRDTTWVASFVQLDAPRWLVISSGAVDEFSAPFLRMRALLMALVIAVSAGAMVAFFLLTRRATRSLAALSAAADDVGRGNFEPQLPPPGRDEVGRLAGAFSLMIGKVRDMLREVESSRHMAAVGAFASQISHEIRNPLTSIKLNLQRLDRAADAASPLGDRGSPVTICLREIERLDRVVRGVLTMGRERPTNRAPCDVRQIVDEALAVVRPQLDHQGIRTDIRDRAGRNQVLGSAEHLKAVFLNLFLNAAEAMPSGGRLEVETDSDPLEHPGRIRVRVSDSGPGIAAGLRERIFQPFFTTKADGTGFGLPLALRTVEEHGGRLELVSDNGAGATFVIDLPLIPGSRP